MAPGAEIVMTTVSTADEAAALSAGLIEHRLAACVQELAITSRYRWEGEVQSDAEVLLLIKTAPDRTEAIKARLAAEHPYDVPEVLVVPTTGGGAAYLEWVAAATRPDPD